MYVNRNNEGKIIGIFANAQFEGQEYVEGAEIFINAKTIIDGKKSTIRSAREGILNRLAGIALAAGLAGDDATTAAYLVVRATLLDITKNLPTDPEQVDATIRQRYMASVAQCTPSMISAFAQVDA